MRPNRKNINLIVLVLLIGFSVTNAAYIELGDSGWAAITDDQYAVEIQVNEVGYDEVNISISKSFESAPDEFGFFQPIVIEFEKIADSPRSVIAIEEELVFNNTGVEWLDYHMFLMVSMQNPQAGFSKMALPDGGQLEGVSYGEYGSGYNNLPIQLDFLNLEGQGVLPSPSNDNTLAIGLDVAEASQVRIVTDDLGMAIGERFGFKQVPTIPEPATMFFLGLGVAFAVKRNEKKSGRV